MQKIPSLIKGGQSTQQTQLEEYDEPRVGRPLPRDNLSFFINNRRDVAEGMSLGNSFIRSIIVLLPYVEIESTVQIIYVGLRQTRNFLHHIWVLYHLASHRCDSRFESISSQVMGCPDSLADLGVTLAVELDWKPKIHLCMYLVIS